MTTKRSLWNRILGKTEDAILKQADDVILNRAPQSRKLTCYISYSSVDGRLYAYELSKLLAEQGIDSLRADSEIESGESWIEVIRDGLARADAMIFVGSPKALTSRFTQIEFDYASRRHMRTVAIVFGTSYAIPNELRQFPWLVERGDEALLRGPSKETVTVLLSTLEGFAIRQAFKSDRLEPISPTPAEKRPLNEGKLILVGRGEVGKTSLVRRLMNEEFRGDESKTQGINITTWQVLDKAETFKLHIWDFGGQEIMHATHQFFLTERSLYLLVLNGREGGEDVDAEYWLKHIESFGGDSPVIVVQNKIAQHPFELNYRGLQARYPQIRGFIKTDCKDLIGVADLQQAIQEAVAEMPEVRMQFPLDWFAVKERLEKTENEFISYDGFRELCAEEGIADEADLATLSWVLHCLGIALNYRDDVRLRETSVLKPQWVTEGIYKILNAATLVERRGELRLEDLGNILPASRYPSARHLFLIELMRKFSLCLPFADQGDRYLIPELLGKEQPEETLTFSPSECLNFEYHYGIVPEGLLPRFIVRAHTLSRGQERWRSGVILAHEDCKALVAAEPAERRVIIRVKGGDAGARRRLLAIIRYDFDSINAEFKDRLEVQPRVPLTDFPNFSVDYKKLLAFERQRVASFPEFIGNQVVNVRVSELLNGVDFEEQVDKTLEALTRAKTVFFSYSHRDETLRDELETHLKLLQRQGVISAWHDRKILPGEEWDREIDTHLEAARITLLLVSADFIASDYCWDKEVKRALERHASSETTVIPVLLRSCDWERAPFGKLQGLPKGMTAITAWNDRDAAWTDVAKGIRATAESLN
jgi:internalin A